MNGQITPHKWPPQERSAPLISAEDLHDIRQNTLSNISIEIRLVSDLIEENMNALSGEFMRLVKYSKQQVDDMTLACELLQGEDIDKKKGGADEVHEILKDSAKTSNQFSKNVNQIIYTMQFQDQTKQVMGAISAALDILGRLSSSSNNLASSSNNLASSSNNLASSRTNMSLTAPLSENNRNLLDQLIAEVAQKDLDQNYILRMFLGAEDKDNLVVEDAPDDDTGIDFF